jgi:hypothetical protein
MSLGGSLDSTIAKMGMECSEKTLKTKWNLLVRNFKQFKRNIWKGRCGSALVGLRGVLSRVWEASDF